MGWRPRHDGRNPTARKGRGVPRVPRVHMAANHSVTLCQRPPATRRAYHTTWAPGLVTCKLCRQWLGLPRNPD